MASSTQDNKTMPIAIVGIGCRFPGGANDVDSMWKLLSGNEGAWSPLPQDRYNAEHGFYHPYRQRKGYMNIKGGYFIKDVGNFDARFFGVTAGEALAMDPQQRILLECTYEALEDAGLPKESIAGSRTGVFVTGNRCDYQTNQSLDWCSGPTLTAIATHTSMLANGLSFHFDLRGPSTTADTACSSSVYALHQAAWSMQTGESDMAILAGCALNLSPGKMIYMSYTGLLNPEGRTYSFDERAKGGYACGEGAGVLVLKPLHKAVADNDRIYSVIHASALNHGGKSASVTAPNSTAQEQLIRELYANTNLNMNDVGFVEAHAAGTRVGDPVEVQAVFNAFRPDQDTERQEPLMIGSVKSHIGHLESVSGIASIIKAALMLSKRTLVPNADLQELNSKIPFRKMNMDVPRKTLPWPAGKSLVSVNNFGFGGANAHCVLGMAPETAAADAAPVEDGQPQPERVFVMAAGDDVTAGRIAENFAGYLESNPSVDIADLAYTLGERRAKKLSYRMAVVATDGQDITAKLRDGSVTPKRVLKNGDAPKIAFVFNGQGAQWFGMARELFQSYPVFAQVLQSADEYFRRLGGEFSLIDELFTKEESYRIDEPVVTQPACTAIQCALVDLLATWNITPFAVVGHSSGEIAAAYAAGLVTLHGALAIAFHRGQAMLELEKSHPEISGTMMAVGADKSVIQPLVAPIRRRRHSGVLSIACENSPQSSTVAGRTSMIDELAEVLEAEGIYHRKLGHKVAYHSPHMELVAQHYAAALERVGPLSDPETPKKAEFFSSRYGHRTDVTDAAYWVDTMTKPVKFSQALQDLCRAAAAAGPDAIIELGPHSTLQTPIKQCLKAVELTEKTQYFPTIVRKKSAITSCLNTAARLFEMGQNVDLGKINNATAAPMQRKLVSGLPKYPWPRNEANYYYSLSHLVGRGLFGTTAPDILGQKVAWSNGVDMTWRNMVTLDDMPWVRRYRVDDVARYPLAGYVCLALEAAAHQAITREKPFESFALRDFEIVEPLSWPEGEEVEMITTLRGTENAEDNEFTLTTWSSARGWKFNCRGLIGVREKTFSSRSISAQAPTPHLLAQEPSRQDSAMPSRRSSPTPLEEKPHLSSPVSSLKSASSVFTLPEITASKTEFRLPTIIHPHNLDALLQSFKASQEVADNRAYSIDGFEALNLDREFPRQAGTEIHLATFQASGDAGHRILGSTGADSSHHFFEVKGLMASIEPTASSGTTVAKAPALCSRVVWEKIDVVSQTEDVPSDDIMLVDDGSPQSKALCEMLSKKLDSGKVETASIETANASGKVSVLVCGVDHSAANLADFDEKTFGKFKQVLQDSEAVLCVVSGAYKDCTNPDANMVTGLIRTMRAETLAKVALLDLQPIPDEKHTSFSDAQAGAVKDVLRFVQASGLGADMEFAEENGALFVPRIDTDVDLDQVVASHSKGEQAPFQQPWTHEKRVKLAAGALPGDLCFEADESQPLREDEIEIAVSSTRVRQDDAQSMLHGHFDSHLVEYAGVIARKGLGVHTLSVGDRVCGFGQDSGVRTFARCRSDRAIRVPDYLSLDIAATVLLPYSTAYWAIMELGRIRNGQTVVIAAQGTLRDAMVQIAEVAGANTFVLANSSYEKYQTQHTYRLAENCVLNAADGNIAGKVMHATHGAGADLVAVSDVSGELLRDCHQCVASFGHVMDVSERRAKKMPVTLSAPRNASYTSFDFDTLQSTKSDVAAVAADGVSRLLHGGLISPAAPTSHGFTDLSATLDKIVEGGSKEAHVINPRAGEMIKAAPTHATKLNSDGYYIIVGGTGGIGRSLARWMVKHGARKIVLLSRSGKMDERVTALIHEARADSAEIMVKACDVSKKDQVQTLVEECKIYGHPRGVIQSAMVLRDTLFENMSFEDYQLVTQPKVAGSWNLHNALLGSELDFFIMLSSTAGIIGNRGQAAYASGNTFLDAFAQYRARLGLPAVSIDLGAIEGIGYIHDAGGERAEEIARNIGAGGSGIGETEILGLVAGAIQGAMDVSCTRHCLTGFAAFTGVALTALSQDARFTYLVKAAEREGKTSSGGGAGGASPAAMIKSAATPAEARAVATDLFAAKLAEILSMSMDEVKKSGDILTRLDSLTAIEFQNWIATRCQARLKLLDLLGISALDELITKVLERVRPEWS